MRSSQDDNKNKLRDELAKLTASQQEIEATLQKAITAIEKQRRSYKPINRSLLERMAVSVRQTEEVKAREHQDTLFQMGRGIEKLKSDLVAIQIQINGINVKLTTPVAAPLPDVVNDIQGDQSSRRRL